MYTVEKLTRIGVFSLSFLGIGGNRNVAPLAYDIPLTAESRPAAAVILCYHSLVHNPQTPYAVSVDNFTRQMEWIAKSGYHVIPLSRFVDLLDNSHHLPDSLVVITFDDGYESIYTEAWPVLKKLGFPFSIFIYTNFINHAKNSLNWEQVRAMANTGVEVGSHSVSHPVLTRRRSMSAEGYYRWVWKELTESKVIISGELGQGVNYFAYPYGAYDDSVEVLARRVYRVCLLVNGGVNDGQTDLGLIDRIIITRSLGLAQFKRILGRHRIDLAEMEPLPGEEVASPDPVGVRAFVNNEWELKAKTIRFEVTQTAGTATVDTSSGFVEFRPKQPLKRGFHEAIVRAENIYGESCEGRWIFLVR